MQDVNALYRREPALYQVDFDAAGFEWIDCNDHESSTIALMRRAEDRADWVLAVLNWTPVTRRNYRVGVFNPRGHGDHGDSTRHFLMMYLFFLIRSIRVIRG